MPALLLRGELLIANELDQLAGLGLVVRYVGSLIDAGQEARAPQLRPHHRQTRAEHDEARQVLVLRAQTVGEPGSHGRAAGELIAGVHHEQRRFVVRAVRVHGADDADIVDALAQIREDLADLDAALSEFFELEGRLEQVTRLALGFQIGCGHGLAVILGQHRLGVESVHLRGPAIEEQEDHSLGFGSEMRGLHFERVAGELARAEHAAQAEHSESTTHGAKNFAACHVIFLGRCLENCSKLYIFCLARVWLLDRRQKTIVCPTADF